MKIGLISDTHITEKRGKLSQKVLDSFKNVDLILHAGDISSQSVLDALNSITSTIAVEGNNDRTHKTLDLNPTEIIEINDLRIVLNHGDKLQSENFDKHYESMTHNYFDCQLYALFSQYRFIKIVYNCLYVALCL